MRHSSTVRGLTSQEACTLVYQYLYTRLDVGQRQRLVQHRAQLTATGLCGNCWQVSTWLAGFGQWHISTYGAKPEVKPADATARRSLWQLEQN